MPVGQTGEILQAVFPYPDAADHVPHRVMLGQFRRGCQPVRPGQSVKHVSGPHASRNAEQGGPGADR